MHNYEMSDKDRYYKNSEEGVVFDGRRYLKMASRNIWN